MTTNSPEFSKAIDSLRRIRGIRLSPMVGQRMRRRLQEALGNEGTQGTFADESRFYSIVRTTRDFYLVVTQYEGDRGIPANFTYCVFGQDRVPLSDPFACATISGRWNLVDQALEDLVGSLGGRAIRF